MAGTPIVEVAFRSRRDDSTGVEVLRLRDVLSRAPDAFERIDFSLVILEATQRFRHLVDFEEYELEPRSVLRISGGQVHRWNRSAIGEADATILVVVRGVADAFGLDPEPWRLGHDRLLSLSRDDQAVLGSLTATIRTLQDRLDGSAGGARELALCAGAVATRLRTVADRVDAPLVVDGLTSAFLSALSADGRLRSVQAVARELGYSSRHLHRAVAGDTGRPPRSWLTERAVLEAQRLLAQTDLTAAAIAARLGFTDPSHFSRLFRQTTGLTPTAFRNGVDGSLGS